MLTTGTIIINEIDGVIRLTVQGNRHLQDDRLDQLEAEGDTLAEALINLHALVEAIQA